MSWKYIIVGMLMLMPLMSEAQKKKAHKPKARKGATVKKKTTVTKTRKPPPAWGATKDYKGNNHIYYPDYYAFYDPKRGYVYWNVATNSWTTSQEIPAFMTKVEMTKTRVEVLKGLSLDLYPERNYPNYMKMYPAQSTDPNVPVPNHRQGAK